MRKISFLLAVSALLLLSLFTVATVATVATAANTSTKAKNKRLLQVLNDDYLDEDIVSIERIEISAAVWRITYRR